MLTSEKRRNLREIPEALTQLPPTDSDFVRENLTHDRGKIFPTISKQWRLL